MSGTGRSASPTFINDGSVWEGCSISCNVAASNHDDSDSLPNTDSKNPSPSPYRSWSKQSHDHSLATSSPVQLAQAETAVA
jgi:hypothetical protein